MQGSHFILRGSAAQVDVRYLGPNGRVIDLIPLTALEALDLVGPQGLLRLGGAPAGVWASLELSTEQVRDFRRRRRYPLVLSLTRERRLSLGVIRGRSIGPRAGFCQSGFRRVTGLRIRRAYFARCRLHENVVLA